MLRLTDISCLAKCNKTGKPGHVRSRKSFVWEGQTGFLGRNPLIFKGLQRKQGGAAIFGM